MNGLQDKRYHNATGELSDEITKVAGYLQQRGDIKQAILFGSLVIGRERLDSDIDLAIEKNHRLNADEKVELIEQLALITGRAIDLIDLKTAGEPILGQIINKGKRLHGTDTAFAEIALKHIYAQVDFVPYIERSLKERRQKWLNN